MEQEVIIMTKKEIIFTYSQLVFMVHKRLVAEHLHARNKYKILN